MKLDKSYHRSAERTPKCLVVWKPSSIIPMLNARCLSGLGHHRLTFCGPYLYSFPGQHHLHTSITLRWSNHNPPKWLGLLCPSCVDYRQHKNRALRPRRASQQGALEVTWSPFTLVMDYQRKMKRLSLFESSEDKVEGIIIQVSVGANKQ